MKKFNTNKIYTVPVSTIYVVVIKNWHDISLLQPSHGECLSSLL